MINKIKYKQQILIISKNPNWRKSSSIWGTGGWLPPEGREDLDWFMLTYFLGWKAIVIGMHEINTYLENGGFTWIIFACSPESIDIGCLKRLFELTSSQEINIVIRQGDDGLNIPGLLSFPIISQKTTFREIIWQGPGNHRKWDCSKEVSIAPLQINENCQVWAMIHDQPLISCIHVGEHNRLIVMGFHPSELRDIDGVFSSLLKHMLIFGHKNPVAWIDWSGSMMLRMDDPGSSETVHHHIYEDQNKLCSKEWRLIKHILEKHEACLNIGYVSGWVDDGDESRGSLRVENSSVNRLPGTVYPSPYVQYTKQLGEQGKVYDYCEEYSGINSLINEGLAEIAVHGYTHIYPDYHKWLSSPDCYEAEKWYREFGPAAMEYIDNNLKDEEAHPLFQAISLINKYFGKHSKTLINPGEVFTDQIQLKALELGFKMISSYYTAIRIENCFCWTQHLCAPYLDVSSPTWFTSELPVIGYFHDFDISRFGTEWLNENIDKWKKAGASYFYDFTTFYNALDLAFYIVQEENNYILNINDPNTGPGNTVKIGVKLPQSANEKNLAIRQYQQEIRTSVEMEQTTYRVLYNMK